MSKLNPVIKNKRINRISFEILHSVGGEFDLKVNFKIETKNPREANNTLLVLVEAHLFTPEKDFIDIICEENIIFTMDYQPDEDDSNIGEEVVPLTQLCVFEDVDRILETMGYDKLGLKENFKV